MFFKHLVAEKTLYLQDYTWESNTKRGSHSFRGLKDSHFLVCKREEDNQHHARRRKSCCPSPPMQTNLHKNRHTNHIAVVHTPACTHIWPSTLSRSHYKHPHKKKKSQTKTKQNPKTKKHVAKAFGLEKKNGWSLIMVHYRVLEIMPSGPLCRSNPTARRRVEAAVNNMNNNF